VFGKPIRIFVAYFSALAFVALIPLVIGMGFEVPFAMKDSREASKNLRQAEVQLAAARIDRFVDRPALLLAELSGLYFAEWNPEQVRPEIDRVLKLSPELVKVSLVDRSNTVALAVDRTTADERNSVLSQSDLDLVIKARLMAKVAYGNTKFADGKGYKISAAVPNKSNSRVFLAEIDLAHLATLLAQMSFSKRGTVFVVNSEGSVIGHTDRNKVIKRSTLSLPTCSSGEFSLAPEVSSGNENSFSFEAMTIASTNWCVVAAEPVYDADQWLWRALIRVISVFGIALICASLLAIWLANKMAKPLKDLVAAVSRVPSKSALPRLVPSPFIEINELEARFTDMSGMIEKSTNDLVTKVNERTKELAEANLELGLVSTRKTEFLNYMSHELRTPLNSVMGFSQMLEAQYYGQLNEKQMEYVGDIRLAGSYLIALVDDLLDLAKIEAGRTELNIELVELSTFVEDTTSFVQDSLWLKKVDLQISMNAEMVWLFDSRRIRQCLLNLLSNAIKFSPIQSDIRLDISSDSDRLTFRISDRGPGIAVTDLPQIFSQFFQGTHGKANSVKGSGLGLALTKGLVILHGGDIFAMNELSGAVFEFWIPKVPISNSYAKT
jgi:signal transduction histidine kinase